MRLFCTFEKEAKLSHGLHYSLIYTPNVLDHLGSPSELPQMTQGKMFTVCSVKKKTDLARVMENILKRGQLYN